MDIQDNKRIIYLSIIAICLILGSIIFYAIKNKQVKNQSNQKTEHNPLSSDFVNDEIVTKSNNKLPEDYLIRLQKQKNKFISVVKSDKDTEEMNLYQAYLGLANTEREIGDYSSAKEYYQQALQKYPDDYLLWHNLGVLYEDMHQYLSAAEAYQRSVIKKPAEPLAHLKLAGLYIRHSQHPKKAKEIYLKALQDTNNDLQTMKEFADFLERVDKNIPESLLYWQEISKKMPDNQTVKNKIKHLQEKLNNKK